MLSSHSVGTYQEKELACNLSEDACLELSQLAEPLWTDPGPKIGTGEPELIFTLNKGGGGRGRE